MRFWTQIAICWLQSIAFLLLACIEYSHCHAEGLAGRTPDSARHTLTIEETLSLARPSNVQISSDGTMVAYVVTTPLLHRNENQAQLFVCPAPACNRPTLLSEGSDISVVRWYGDNQTLYYVLAKNGKGRICRTRYDGRMQEQLTRELDLPSGPVQAEAPLPYEISPDGASLVYAVYDLIGAEHAEAAAIPGGIAYTGEFVRPLSYLEYRKLPVDLWLLNVHTRQETKIWTTQTFGPLGSTLPEFRWSPDGKSLALLFPQPGVQRYTLALLDVRSGLVNPLSTTLGFTRALRWTDDGKSLLFYSEGEIASGESRKHASVYTFELSDHSLHQLTANQLSLRLAYEASSEGSVEVARAVQNRSGDLLSSCSLDARGRRAACVREAPTVPPEVVTVELNQGDPEQAPLLITHLNPGYDSVALGNVSRLSWPNGEGEGSAGLILPVGFVPGHKYPVLVMLYNLYSGRTFIADAGGFTSYPAQTFAGHGYVVLLMNVPHYYTYKPGDFAAARKTEVDAVVADIQSALDILAQRGIIDSSRMGLMGWSGGCFWTNYIVTHYPTWFQAAASGECAVHYPGQYWLGDDHWRKQEDDFFGGGPFGEYYSRWKEISPVLNADRLRIPLLMEYSTFYPAGLEMRTAIVKQSGQAELFIYGDDTHVLHRPLNRYNSMSRHFDWFNFWLLGEKDSDPKKRTQYANWIKLRSQRQQTKRKYSAWK